MIDQEYCGEIEDLLTQFVAAFDDARIIRKRKNSDVQEIIIPRWIVAGKPRVFHDIINQAKNITLPVAVVEPQGISLRSKDLENKNSSQARFINGSEFKFKQPTPIDLKLSVTFYSKYLSDIWQMGSNFIAFSRPSTYITVTNPVFDQYISEKINCKVTWDGNYSIKYANPVNPDDNWLISATASLTIEGFIFQKPVHGGKIITSVHTTIAPCTYNMMSIKNEADIDYLEIDGWPTVTSAVIDNISVGNKKERQSVPLTDKTVSILGRSFFTSQNTGIIITGDIKNVPEYLERVSITTIKHGTLEGFNLYKNTEELNKNKIEISENKIVIKPLTPINDIPTPVTLYVYNNAGFINVNDTLNLNFYL